MKNILILMRGLKKKTYELFTSSRSSLLRTLVYTIGHFFIAAGVILTVGGVSLIVAMTDAIVEPLLNSVWYFCLDKWWASKPSAEVRG